MKKFNIILLSLLTSTGLAGQELLPVRGYFHLVGRIGNNIQVIMDLVKVQDSLYSSFSFSAENYNRRSYDVYYSNPKTLCGKIDPDGSFWLKEVFNDSVPEIKGAMTGNGLVKGTWEVGTNHNKLPFELIEKYPEGSIQFNVYSLKDSKPISNKVKSPRGDISMTLLIPAESSNPVISDSLSPIIIEKFSDRKDDIRDPEKLLERIKQVYYENYITSNESLYKEFPTAGGLNWELLKFMHVLFNAGNHLTFYILTYAFSGGAHGLEIQEFYSVDLTNGKLLSLDNVLKEGYQETLSGLLTRKVHEIYGIPSSQKLKEAGFFVDIIKPNNNFYLTGNGIGFFYNHYDIAPYSTGPTDIFFAFEELRAILK